MKLFLIIILVIYVISAILIGLYDIQRVSIRGKKFYERKRMLESLASVHGYSPSGWNRYHEYQVFMEEYGIVIELYEDYKKKKVRTILNIMLSPFLMVPLYAKTGIEILFTPIEKQVQEKEKEKDI